MDTTGPGSGTNAGTNAGTNDTRATSPVRSPAPITRTISRRGWRRVGLLLSVALSITVVLTLLLGVWRPQTVASAHASRAALDHELTHARSDLGIPERLLAPITGSEKKLAAGDGGLLYNYADAATHYRQLYIQLHGIEQSAPSILQVQAQTDLQTLATLLNQRRTDGVPGVTRYQTRYDDLQTAFSRARLPGDYDHVSALATAATQALIAMGTTYDRLQHLQQLLQSLHAAGLSTTVPQQTFDQGLQTFGTATSADDFQRLATAINIPLTQLIADDIAVQPYLAASLLQAFQAHIDQLKQYGDATDAATFQQQHDDAAGQLAAARLPTAYAPIVQALTQADAATALPIAKAKATQDFGILQQLVDSSRSKTVINPADHKAYPAAYEYTSRAVGIGDASDNLHAATSVKQYTDVDFEITSLTACLKAMLSNMNDGTAHNQVHQTDLQLLDFFQVTTGRVVIISLREQTARFYQDGHLVNWSYVTTGRPELPSVPGWHVAMARLSPTTFTSPDPAGSPGYYQPTHINYAVEYNTNGYFLHDAWWRSWFGPNSNLPHHDPAAFNGGSHGCVNFPESNMRWVYNWTVKGTPVILY